MTDPIKVTVEGIPEVVDALEKVRRFDRSEAAMAAADVLLPDIAANSRKATGALQTGWDAVATDDGAVFVNQQFYWTFQEFGTVYIEPTNAVWKSWTLNSDAALDAFGNVIQETVNDAGLGED